MIPRRNRSTKGNRMHLVGIFSSSFRFAFWRITKTDRIWFRTEYLRTLFTFSWCPSAELCFGLVQGDSNSENRSKKVIERNCECIHLKRQRDSVPFGNGTNNFGSTCALRKEQRRNWATKQGIMWHCVKLRFETLGKALHCNTMDEQFQKVLVFENNLNHFENTHDTYVRKSNY